MTGLVTTTLLLPIIGGAGPCMCDQPRIAVVWVDTSRDRWGDTTGARTTFHEALAWWEARTGVALETEERTLTIAADPYAVDVCHDRAWLPSRGALPTLYLIAAEPTGRVFVCDEVNVADYTLPWRGALWGGIRADEAAHAIGHLYGARDETTPGIMDWRTLKQSYERGDVTRETLEAVGVTRAGASGLSARGPQGYRAGARPEVGSYLLNAAKGAFRI